MFGDEGSYEIVSVPVCLGVVHFLLCVVYCRLSSLDMVEMVSVKLSVTGPTDEDLVCGIVSVSLTVYRLLSVYSVVCWF